MEKKDPPGSFPEEKAARRTVRGGPGPPQSAQAHSVKSTSHTVLFALTRSRLCRRRLYSNCGQAHQSRSIYSITNFCDRRQMETKRQRMHFFLENTDFEADPRGWTNLYILDVMLRRGSALTTAPRLSDESSRGKERDWNAPRLVRVQ